MQREFIALTLLVVTNFSPQASPACDNLASSVSRDVTAAPQRPAVIWHDTERIIFLGGTFIERAQRFGYLETAIVRRLPGNTINVRNLGWSGDTVFAESRGIFDPPAKGYARMLDQVRGLKPTVIVLAYGVNESFAGTAGLPRFLKQLGQLIEDLNPTQAQIVLASPHWHATAPPPLPDPTTRNKNLELYIQALTKYAEQHKLPFLNLRRVLSTTEQSAAIKLTDNGIHPNAAGYWNCAELVAEQLIGPTAKTDAGQWQVEIDAGGQVRQSLGTRLDQIQVQRGTLKWRVRDRHLPAPRFGKIARHARRLKITGLPAGNYVLKIDGQPVAHGSAAEWSQSRTLDNGPEFAQAEQLRRTIVAKNLNYFHRWRPQNVTYLFGFRKHEQGQNAKEVAEFDALVRNAETRIRALSKPQDHSYEIVASPCEERVRP